MNMKMELSAAVNGSQHWQDIDFSKAERHIKKLQKQVSVAYCNDEFDKLKYIQHTLIHSFDAKALAVKIVTSKEPLIKAQKSQ